MVEHQVQDDMNISLVRFLEELLKILKSAKFRINCEVIGDVVAKVHVWGGVDRRKPDTVNAEVFEVVQALDDSL